MNKNNLLDRWQAVFESCPLIAILRGIDPDDAVDTAELILNEGFEIMEIPLNSPAPFETIKKLTAAFPDIFIGAGTVTTERDVVDCISSGCKIIVTPNFNKVVANALAKTEIIYCPGVATPSEAFSAIGSGANALKLFPAEMIPPTAVKAMRAVLPPSAQLIPVGGITTRNMYDYIQAGADGFGIGSALYKPGETAANIRSAAREFVAAYREIQRA